MRDALLMGNEATMLSGRNLSELARARERRRLPVVHASLWIRDRVAYRPPACDVGIL